MKMEATEDYFKGFQKHLTKSGLAIPLDANKALVKRYLTAEFARQLYDDEKYYEIILKEDAMVKAVNGYDVVAAVLGVVDYRNLSETEISPR